MLSSLLIQNIVLIDKLELEMEGGLCVLTGETGSGKSILLDALGLAIGQRSNSRLLRQNEKQGLVVAQFNIQNNSECKKLLEENGLTNPENQDILILRRTLHDNGTSKAFANDIPIGINLLSEIGDLLLEIHGQHEQRGLLNSSFHRAILDEYAGNQKLLFEVGGNFKELNEIENKLTTLYLEKEKNEREKDYLSHVVKELESANVKIGEEESLTQSRNLILNQEKISNLIQELTSQINDADNKFTSAQKSLLRNKNLGNFLEDNSSLEKLIEIIDEISAKSELAKDLLDGILSSLGNRDLTLEEIEERLFLIKNLARKLNVSSNELPQIWEKMKEKLKIVENFSALENELEKAKKSAQKKYLESAKKLSKTRHEAAIKLSKVVEKELSFLKMPSVKFAVDVKELAPENYTQNGIDAVKFIAATNKNSVLDEISKIASGGELSRFMLALKVALSEIKSVPILIFDEIDTGIGGAVADAVGERLKLLSKKLQIMVVTHQPQVAAKSNHHIRIQKTISKKITNTIADILNKSEKEIEIARMLSGEKISEEAVAAARKLIG